MHLRWSLHYFSEHKRRNRGEVPKELTALLDFVKADPAGSEAEYEDTLVKQLQDSMRRVKRSRKMGERYMMFEQYMKEYVQEHADEIREEAREEGLAEGRAKGLEEGRCRRASRRTCRRASRNGQVE